MNRFYLFIFLLFNLLFINYSKADNVIANEQYKESLENKEAEMEIEFGDEIPAPVYEKPSELMVFIRKFGIRVLCLIFDSIDTIKVVKYTI